jgi:ATP-dependent RNA helicase DDX55/SPB4
VEACTGSGKTLAYIVPMMQMLMKKKWEKEEVAAVIITPVR